MASDDEDTPEDQKRVKERKDRRAYLNKVVEYHRGIFSGLKDYVSAWSAGTTLTQPTLPRLQAMQRDLELNKDDQKTTHRDIFMACHGSEYSKYQPRFESIIKDIDEALDILGGIIIKTKAAETATSTVDSFKLEKINLPTFSGKQTEWKAYYDLFMTAVHNDPKKSDVQKIIHLQTSLEGEALAVISSFQPTAANYKEALDTLIKRYDNKREIVFSHLKKFDELKGSQVESASALRSIADTINECMRSLKALKVKTENCDIFVIYYSLKKMDPESKKQWALAQTAAQSAEIPKLENFVEFLETRARALADSSGSSSSPNWEKRKPSSSASHHASTGNLAGCVLCQKTHGLFRCNIFKSKSAKERKQIVSRTKSCERCLGQGHFARDCKLSFSCKKCKSKEHYLLHVCPENTAEPDIQQPEPDPTTVTASAQYGETGEVVLLGTLWADVEGSNGEKLACRVLVDNGSEANFISEHCVDRLRLKRKKACVTITGVNSSAGEPTRGFTSLRLHSKTNTFTLDIGALVVKKVTTDLPRAPVSNKWPHLRGLELGDANYFRPGPIDILLGSRDIPTILLSGMVKGPAGSPMAQQTEFGWVVFGPVTHGPRHYQVHSHHVRCSTTSECIEDSLEKFWKLEEIDPHEYPVTAEDDECENSFLATYKRSPDGGYTVQLPFRANAPALGHSRGSAVKRWKRVESQFPSQPPELKEAYKKGIKEYLDAGYLELVPEHEIKKKETESYYMPHKMVTKLTSTTTKYRIVYDASAKTSTGLSLNDVLLTGPKLQVDLVPLFLRFLTHAKAMSADIVQFYPQYTVAEEHRDYQRLVFREEPHLPIQDYRMRRVTFGVTSAPFLAIRCLHQLAEEEKEDFPSACTVIKEDFLVDNLLSGAETVEMALDLQSQILQVMKRGNLKLRKWASNCEEILDSVPPESRECEVPLNPDETEAVKTIGLLWHPKPDTFRISLSVPELGPFSTKRKILSAVAKTFDPLGWLSPFTVRAKILLQELWMEKLDWDSPLPTELHNKWTKYVEELPTLKKFKIKRWILAPPGAAEAAQYEVHGFCDASKLAYAACVYIRTIDKQGESNVNLVTAKTKVAPVKKETIPRLELCGALLLSQLMRTVKSSVKTEFSVTRCWTDSTCVLDWLNSKKKLQVFETNRVRKITDIIPAHQWSHVPGEENPADAPTRGISASALVQSREWFHGPEWLATRQFSSDTVSCAGLYEEVNHVLPYIQKTSSLTKLKHVIGWCLRYIKNRRAKKEDRTTGPLTAKELDYSLTRIVFCVQQESLKEELKKCKRGETVKSSIKFLSPFIDEFGILRVGGRLTQSYLPISKKVPMLLPGKHKFTELVLKSLHLTHCHAAPQLLLALAREQFWIVRGPDIAKKVVKTCIQCHRQNPATASQLMGQLPPSRVTPSRPFSRTGMDYAGPFYLCDRPGRNPRIKKSYMALFICMATKAIHLELVSDLSTPAFIGALTRFISRRGLPSDLYSDGGKNFVGAANEMREFLRFINSKTHNNGVTDALREKGIQYHFNPPLAPHQGGLWEAGVKSAKTHLKKVIEGRKPSVEEFSTLLCQVEACLNSRPLTQLSTDPNDFEVLTPGHFLVGSSLLAYPTDDLTHLKQNRLSRWQAVQQMVQHFWRRWEKEYLTMLHSRPKWFIPQPNLEPGVLVLIRDDDPAFGPLKWKLGRITKVFLGSDGDVRNCDVMTPNGPIYRRPIVKLSPLPIYES